MRPLVVLLRRVLAFLLLPVLWLPAQVREDSRVVDSGGGASSGGGYLNIGAIGQGTPLGLNTTLQMCNHSGFLNSFLLRPDLDTDGDHIVDENDLDDDNDGLSDTAELLGGGDPVVVTDPLDSDSDGDGTSDGAELVAGTNPVDRLSLLRITRIGREAGQVLLRWNSRSGKVYNLMRGDDVRDLVERPVFVGTINAAAGGTAPWYSTETEVQSPNPVLKSGFYRIEVQP